MRVLNSVLALLLAFGPGTAFAAIPDRINFQGRLLDNNKQPRNGNFAMTFKICDSAAGACSDCPPGAAVNCLWTEDQTIAVSNGVFAAQLGAVSALGASVFSANTRYLEIVVAGETLSPRERLLPASYAFRTAVAEGLANDALTADAQIAAGANISDSKLAAITTAGKVSGAALTSLSSVPGGAGALPDANLSSNVTIQGNTFNGNNQLLQLDGSGRFPATKVGGGAVDDTEFGRLDGVTSAIQTQFAGKLDLAPTVSQTVTYGADLQTILRMFASQAAAPFRIETSAGVNRFSIDLNGNVTTGGWQGSAVGVGYGGTGLASGTDGGILGFSAAGTIASSALLATNGVVLGGGAGATPTATAAGGADTVLRVPSGGGAPAFGAVDVSKAAAVTGTLAVGNGGTGQASLTSNNVILGNGASAVGFVAPGAAGNVLASNGTTWTSGANKKVISGRSSASLTASAFCHPYGAVCGVASEATLAMDIP
ncbi:MAG: hypothetical protein HY925_03330, partial [Elusimicrobia bacterium]|nr:hypothetical protein [Elusimicrobiota bacterium]